MERVSHALYDSADKLEEFTPARGRPLPNTRVISVGTNIAGMRCRRVIIGRDTVEWLEREPTRERWWHDTITSRLSINGKVIIL